MSTPGGDDRDWVLSRALRQAIRDALDAGRGRLRMEPQALADRIGAAIDAEVERLGRIRERIEAKRQTAERLAAPESFFIAGNRNNIPATDNARSHFNMEFSRKSE